TLSFSPLAWIAQSLFAFSFVLLLSSRWPAPPIRHDQQIFPDSTFTPRPISNTSTLARRIRAGGCAKVRSNGGGHEALQSDPGRVGTTADGSGRVLATVLHARLR